MVVGYAVGEVPTEIRAFFQSQGVERIQRVMLPCTKRTQIFLSEVQCFTEGDVVVTDMKYIATDTKELIEVHKVLKQRGIELLLYGIEGSCNHAKIISYLSTLNELLHEVKSQKVQQGKKLAKQRGVHDGRPQKYQDEIIQEMIQLLNNKTLHEVAEITGIPYGTVRYYKRLHDKRREN